MAENDGNNNNNNIIEFSRHLLTCRLNGTIVHYKASTRTRTKKKQYKDNNTYLLTPWSRVLLEKLTGFAANQEIPRILWNPKVYYRTHKRPLMVDMGKKITKPLGLIVTELWLVLCLR